MRPALLLLCLVALGAGRARAQAPSNADALGRLAAACLAGVPVPAAFHLAVPAGQPYLRSALTGALGPTARLLADSTAPARLRIDVERAAIAYRRAGRGRLHRTAVLRLRTQVVDEAGLVRYDAPCTQEAADVITARQRSALEDLRWPETLGMAPTPSRLRRVLETGLVAGAIVTSTLLLFSLRSR